MASMSMFERISEEPEPFVLYRLMEDQEVDTDIILCGQRALALLDSYNHNKDNAIQIDELSCMPIKLLRSQIHNSLAVAFGNDAVAQQHYNLAMVSWNKNVVSAFNCAEYHREKGNVREALNWYEKCLALEDHLLQVTREEDEDEDDEKADFIVEEMTHHQKRKNNQNNKNNNSKMKKTKQTVLQKQKVEEQEELNSIYGGWWGDELLTACLEALKSAKYMMCITLHLSGSKNDSDYARELLSTSMNIQYRISQNVWNASKIRRNPKIRFCPIITPSITKKKKKNLSENNGGGIIKYPKVQMWQDALPESVGHYLKSLFHPETSFFWNETDYHHRGYYSFWYDIQNKQPSNAVEAMISQYLFPLVKERLTQQYSDGAQCPLVGCEWWCHSRPIKNSTLGHQLHFDTDELALTSPDKELHHPAFGSVVYLAGGRGGAPTLVLDQTPPAHHIEKQENNSNPNQSDEKSSNPNQNDDESNLMEGFATRGWISHPRNRSFLIFEGNLLHGVLPDITSSQSFDLNEEEDENRLTLMVGWWLRNPTINEQTNREKNKRKKKIQTSRYGPCCPVPPVSRTSNWVSQLKEVSQFDDTSDAKVVEVTELSPVWEAIHPSNEVKDINDDHGSDEDEIPSSLDGHFFVKSLKNFDPVTKLC